MSNTNNVMRNNYKYFDVDGLGAIPEKVSKALKIRIGYVLKSADVGTLFSGRNSEN